MGFEGKVLGYELDLEYSRKAGRNMELGLSGAYAIPGNAWKVEKTVANVGNFLLQASATFRF